MQNKKINSSLTLEAQKTTNRKSKFNDKPISNVVIYARSATSNGYSIEGQVISTKEFAEKNSYNILKIFIDNGKSARTLDRPAFKEMVEYCKNSENKVDAIIVSRLDRITRSATDYKEYINPLLEKYNIRLLSTTEPNDNSIESELMRNISISFAEYESRLADLKSEKCKKCRLYKRKMQNLLKTSA